MEFLTSVAEFLGLTNPSPSFILAQIMGMLGITSTIIIYQQKDRSKLLVFKISSDIAWSAHYLFLSRPSGLLICVIAIFREFVFMNRKKHKWAAHNVWPVVFVSLALGSMALTWNKEGAISIMPAVASAISVISFWIGNPKLARKLVFIIAGMMIAYDVVAGSYTGIINEAFGLTSAIIGIVRLDVGRFEKGMMSVTFRGKSISEVVEIAAKAKLSFIEWGGDVHIKPGDFDAVKKAKSLMRKHHIACKAYGSYYRVGDNDPDGFAVICKTAAILGAMRVRVWLGRKGSAETTEDERAALIAETRVLADIAARYSLDLAFEFHGKTFNDNGASCAAFIADCGKSNVKTYWQPLAFGDNADNLEKAVKYVDAVHVFFWNEQNERFPLKDGFDEWRKYVAMLRSASRHVPMTLEFVKDDSDEQFLADAETLGEIIKK
ncbi:MAG: YgjV family protein [Clostridia bacterium]|nr:YgjV family protein [Clostridia bacterium]